MTTGRTEEGDKDTDKKEWRTPRLRVFVRTRPEETILTSCKGNLATISHDWRNNRCQMWTIFCVTGCNALATS